MLNLIYFTKYLPSSDSPSLNSIIRVSKNKKLAKIISWENSFGFTNIQYLEDGESDLTDEYEVVKLFLCSRNIQIGDTFFDQAGRKWENAEECLVRTAIDWNKHKSKNLADGNTESLTNYAPYCYKIIGEISSNDNLITEGMEINWGDFYYAWENDKGERSYDLLYVKDNSYKKVIIIEKRQKTIKFNKFFYWIPLFGWLKVVGQLYSFEINELKEFINSRYFNNFTLFHLLSPVIIFYFLWFLNKIV